MSNARACTAPISRATSALKVVSDSKALSYPIASTSLPSDNFSTKTNRVYFFFNLLLLFYKILLKKLSFFFSLSFCNFYCLSLSFVFVCYVSCASVFLFGDDFCIICDRLLLRTINVFISQQFQ